MKHKLLIVALSLVVPALHAGPVFSIGGVAEQPPLRNAQARVQPGHANDAHAGPGFSRARRPSNGGREERARDSRWLLTSPEAAHLRREAEQGNRELLNRFLLMSAHIGDEGLVRHWLAYGANASAADRGCTVLMTAVQAGNEGMVRQLISAGANVDAVSRKGSTALSIAIWSENEHMAQLLLRAGARANRPEGQQGPGPLLDAVAKGLDPTVRALLALGADFSAQYEGYPVLFFAVEPGHATVVQQLLDAGADPNAVLAVPALRGKTLLMVASSFGHVEVVRLLLDAGADRTIADSNGDTALTFARRQGHEAIVRLLGAQIEGH